MKIKYFQATNGKFAVCPKCGKPMAKKHDLKYKLWTCLYGCGYVLKEA